MKSRKRKWITLVLLAGAAAAAGTAIYTRTKQMAVSLYEEETVQRRNIRTWHSFTGTVAPILTRQVRSGVSGVKVASLLVREGDQVVAGDLLLTLDSSGLEEQIAEKQAGIDAASYSNALSIQSAQKSYDNLKSNLNTGMDTSVMNAQNSLDSAYASLVQAQQAYNDEVSLNNDQKSTTILNAKQAADTAYDTVQARVLATQQAKEKKEKNIKDAEENHQEYDPFADDQAIATAELNEKQAWNAYNQALEKYEQAKTNEENSLTKLYDQLMQAQNSYLNAVDTYNAAVNSSRQQLETYEMQIQQAQASANDTVNRLQLSDLKTQLGDYAVYAPADGEITSLDIEEGDIVSGSSASLMTIVNFDEMKVDIKIGEYDILGVETGQPVTITIDALNKDYPGTIVHIDRIATVENGVSYYEAEVDFTADEYVRSGMSAEVRLTVSDLTQVVTISNDAIQTAADGTSFVTVEDVEGQKISWPVSLGATDGTYTEIRSGLADGETIYYMPVQDLISQRPGR